MYVASCPFHYTSLDDAIAALKALPSAFPPERTRVSTDFTYANAEALALNEAGLAALDESRATGDREKLGTACEAFNKAARKSADSKDDLAQAENIFNYGYTAALMGDYAAAVSAMEEAVELHTRAGSPDLVFNEIGDLYDALYNHLKQPQSDPEELSKKIAAVQKKILWACENRGREPVNLDAYRVEQNEIGFSDEAPLGTDNVCDCICVIVRDPVTHKTGLAHIDCYTDIHSLQSLFDRMPAQAQLEVKLVGACLGNDPTSMENMRKVINFFANKNVSTLSNEVNILSTDIYGSDQPRALVVDPKTGDVTEQRPGKENPDKDIGNGLPWAENKGKPLHVAFDLTQSPKRAPHLLAAKEIGYIQSYGPQLPQKNYAAARVMGANPWQLAIRAEHSRICAKAWQDAVQYLTEIVDRQIAEKEKAGVKVPPEHRNGAIAILRTLPLHIGADADAFNRPLEEFIRTKLFRTSQDGTTCRLNRFGLYNVQLRAVPYEKIEAEKKPPAKASPRNGEAIRP
jgi:hypothetical protein